MREGLVSWSVETLLLALIVIGVLCALYVAVKAFQQSPKWGVLFALGPALFYGIMLYAGWLVAGLVVMATQLYFVRQPYNWKSWGRIYVYMVLCWAGGTWITGRESGWLPFRSTDAAAQVAQAGASRGPAATEDFLPMEGGRIWYRKVGTGTGLPVIVVHGGPGLGSFHLKAFEALGDERAVVRYDQLGAGRADRAVDTALFTMPRYARELDSLRAALGFEKVHLIGHSLGAMLAFEYYQANPQRVASLTLTSPILDTPAWVRATRELIKTLPDTLQQAIAASETSGDYDSPDYHTAAYDFSTRYIWRRPIEVELDSMKKSLGIDPYWHMWGPSDFTVTGTLRDVSVTRRLRRIAVPTLYTVGQYDALDSAMVRRYSTLTPGAQFALITDAAHTATWDNPEEIVRVVRRFLAGVETPAAPDSAARADSTPPTRP